MKGTLRLIVAVVTVFVCLCSSAQDLEVASFTEAGTVSSAGYTFNRYDLNDDPCSIIRVELDEEDVKFTGSVVGKARRVEGGYLVYVPQGTKRIKISPLEYLPIEVSFPDYGVAKVKKAYAYVLKFKSAPIEEGVVKLGVTSRPPFAKVYMDGKELGETPIMLSDIPAGHHKIRATLSGYQDYARTHTLQAGTNKEISLMLKKLFPVKFQCNVKEATISIDDEPLSSLDNLQLPEGEHTLSAEANGFQKFEMKIKVSPVGNNVYTVNMFTKVVVKGVEYKMIHIPEAQMKLTRVSASGKMTINETVTLQPFNVGETEVTQQLWEAVMGDNPSVDRGAQMPVTNVSWDDCQVFIEKLNALTGRTFSLPTDLEWEYVASGAQWRKKNASTKVENLDEQAWYQRNSNKQLHKVKQKAMNACGLYDVLGNVSEWCQDLSDEKPVGSTTDMCVCRGGDMTDASHYCTPYFRSSNTKDYRGRGQGLRLVMR